MKSSIANGKEIMAKTSLKQTNENTQKIKTSDYSKLAGNQKVGQ